MLSSALIITLSLLSFSTLVTKLSKQTMLLEAETQRLQEDLEESKKEAQKHAKKIQVLQADLKDAVTWDKHCSITGKLTR